MKPITWLRKIAKRGNQGYPVATLAFYGPDDKKASKAVLGIILSKGSEAQLHKWFRESEAVDLRYDIKLQNVWIEIIRREGVRSVAMLEEINGCPHEEGLDYPLGEVCPECPFWAHRRRPLEPPATELTLSALSIQLFRYPGAQQTMAAHPSPFLRHQSTGRGDRIRAPKFPAPARVLEIISESNCNFLKGVLDWSANSNESPSGRYSL